MKRSTQRRLIKAKWYTIGTVGLPTFWLWGPNAGVKLSEELHRKGLGK